MPQIFFSAAWYTVPVSTSLAPGAILPVAEEWTRVVVGLPCDDSQALDAIRVLASSMSRLAWEGEGEHGDRRRALQWFRQAVEALVPTAPGLATVLDWWMVAALEAESLGSAWSVDRVVPPPTGDAMREILDVGLAEVRRPAMFAAALARLRDQGQRNPGKIAGEKAILTDAMNECRAVVRAGELRAAAPTGLRLADATDEAIAEWAAEGPPGRRVEPGTPVFGHLVKELRARADAVTEALRWWPVRGREPLSLPSGWREALRETCGTGADSALALVAEAIGEPGERALLSPARILPMLARQPADPAARDRVFGVVRELAAAAGQPLPEWTRPIENAVAELEEQISALREGYRGEAAAALEEARSLLEALDVSAAADWLRTAVDEHERASAGADLDRRRAVARERAAWLDANGGSAPVLRGDVAAWAIEVDRAWAAARDRIRQRLDGLVSELAFVPRKAEVEPVLGQAGQALGRSDLGAAVNALDRADALVRTIRARAETEQVSARAALAERLGPALLALADRAAALADCVGVTEVIERVVSRRRLGLDVEAPIADLQSLVALLEAKDPRIAAVVAYDPRTGRNSRVAWVLGGVRTSGSEGRYREDVRPRVSVGGKEPADAVRRVTGWGVVGPDGGPGPSFEREGDLVVGPFPPGPEVAVAALPLDRFAELFGRVDIDGDRWLVPQPPDLGELILAGAEIRDRMDAEAAAAWIANRLRGGAAADWESSGALPPALRTARLARLEGLLAETRALSPLREQAVEAFLRSARGRQTIEAAISAEVEVAVTARRAALDAEIETWRARLAAVQDEVATAEALLGDRKLQLLGQIVGARPAGGSDSAAPISPIRALPFEPSALPPLPDLVAQLAGHTWEREAVANLLLSVATGRWTLLAGLPGVGKSTFVRSIFARLGHGPATERYLELVVRRDWQDDAALFGFWHPTDRAWMPSSEGFVEHLLRAGDDERRGHGGLWPILVEELNLASPEYYLARPISAFEAPEATVRLYDPELSPHNASRYPASFRVPDSVRLVATVNVDDTVERLSPRMLSRASVLWVEARADAPQWRPRDDASDTRISWTALRAGLDGEAADLAPLAPVLRFLEDARVPGGPTARTRAAISRYLAASRALLDPAVAEDFQILQRVLPPLRGVGPRWRRLLDALVAVLERGGWVRSAARARDLRVRGEELGDWYDFFHT
jgi:hypothetical protein